MARRFPSAPSLKRSTETLAPKVEIVIACEGTKTEPFYFEACAKHYGNGLVSLRVLERTGVPLTVVRAAVDEKNRLVARARKLPEGERPSFSVWAVFDRDEHDVDSALELAEQHRIHIAFSNPCFEIWPVLHLDDYGAQNDRHALQKLLKNLMPAYDHQDGASIKFDQIKDHRELATARARRLNAARSEEGCPHGCPSTTVVELVQRIVENGQYRHRIKV